MGILSETFDRTTARASDGGAPAPVPRRQITFTVDWEVCNPGTFDADFELTLQALSTGQEMAAAREAKGDEYALAHAMFRHALYAVDGEEIKRAKGQDRWLWEALGPQGRNLVAAKFTELTAPTEEAQKKATESIRYH